MPLYFKKPGNIEVRNYDGTEDQAYEIIDWIDQASTAEHRVNAVYDCYDDTIVIEQGNAQRLTVGPGEWVIRGVEGEFSRLPASAFTITPEV